MQVRLYATLQDVAGKKVVEVECNDEKTIMEILEQLIGKYPHLKAEIFTESGQLKPYVNVMVNGRSVRWLEGLDTSVSKEDTIAIFPPIAGGSQAAH